MTNFTLALFCAAAAFAAEKHPWAGFKPGSYAKLRTTAMTGPTKTVTEMTQTLVSIDANNAVVETETKVMGQTMKNKITVPLKANAAATPATGAKPVTPVNETVTVAGKPIAAKCYDMETNANGMKTSTRSCVSDSVPGGVVKAVSKSTGAMKVESTTELLEYAAK
jgi:hypothetical protein